MKRQQKEDRPPKSRRNLAVLPALTPEGADSWESPLEKLTARVEQLERIVKAQARDINQANRSKRIQRERADTMTLATIDEIVRRLIPNPLQKEK